MVSPSAPALVAQVRLAAGAFSLDVDLAVQPGATLAILGPNGSGKTTLLHALAGLRPIDEGSIRLDGQVLDDGAAFVAPERRPVALVFQDHLLFPHLDALDNVAFGLRARGAKKAAAREAALVWLERFGLADHRHTRPGGLSGGQAQRVALARALVTEPALLLLDEPLSALDVRTRDEVRRDLRDLLGSVPGVKVLVTHDPLDAATLAGRVVVLEEGKVTQRGRLDELAARPRSAYVAELVGTNAFFGTAEGEALHVRGGGVLVLAEAHHGPVVAVVHPRAVALAVRLPEGSPRNVWTGKVVGLDQVGDRVRIRVDGLPAIVAEVTLDAVAALDLAQGTNVWVSVKATEIAVEPA